jgi:hypothetical protein
MEGSIQDDRYKVVDDIIYYKDMIYLVPESKLKDNILRAVHDAPLAGHQGYLKTYRKVRERFSWKGLKEDVLHHVRECMTFQHRTSQNLHILRDYFNHCRFQSRSGITFPWTSLQGFQRYRAGTVSMW